MTNDYMNNNTGIKYDHRNLITEITKQNLKQDPPTTYITRYRYDEAGNRTRKTVFLSNEYDPPPLPDDEADLPPGWTIIVDDYYSRDVAGREIMVYSSYTPLYWNVWSGGEMTGRINYGNGTRNYYLKDHLGSVRVVIDDGRTVVSANDYDMWGYYLENRTYNTTNTKNKFTGKERDNESTYDYFGARYYDARVGRWGQVEPLLNKYLSFSPYQYGLLNPTTILDVNGKDVRAVTPEAQQIIINTLPPEIRSNIVFDESGYINKTILNTVINNTSGNFEALKTLVNDTRLFDVILESKFLYINEAGQSKEINFGPIEIDDNYDPSPFDPQTKEKGYYGITLLPGINSPDEDIKIYINKELSSKGKSQILSHEGYGHAYMFAIGKNSRHEPENINGIFFESNLELGNQIINRIKETIKNMEEK